jgi:Tfp pilus assembly protein PilN
MLYDIAVAMPERVWIETLKEAGQSVTITGFAASDDVVADFMRSLKAILGAWNVELEIVEQKEKEKMKLAGFTIRLEKPK